MRKTYYFSVPDVLSSCEQEITRLTCIGWSNKQIAERLNLKVEAVQVHLNGIFCKVGVKSRTELVAVLVKRLRAMTTPQLSGYSLGRSAGGRGTIVCFEQELFGEFSSAQGPRSHIAATTGKACLLQT